MASLARIYIQLAVFGFTATITVGEESYKACGGNLTGLHGRFQSPNHPQVYPDFAHCIWNITVPKGYYISLNFSQFEVEGIANCSYDYVEILGRNTSHGKFCGKVNGLDGNFPKGPMKILENRVSVVFHTDYSNEDPFHGFEAIFIAHDVDECKIKNGGCGQFCVNYIGGHYCTCKLGYALAEDGRICLPQCREMLVGRMSGVVQTPEYPNPYPPHADCEWTILSEAGYKIILEYDELDIESHPDYHCPYDVLGITMYGTKIEEEKVCGKRNATTVVTSAVMIHYEFHSDDSLNRKGFRVRFRLQGVRCPKLNAPKHGGFIGPEEPEFKDIVRFYCNETYLLTGKSELRCTDNGSWDFVPPTCKLYSCKKPPVADENTLIRAENYTIGSVIYYGCREGYSLQGSADRLCRPDGTWSGATPTCKPVCGQTNSKRHMAGCTEEWAELRKAETDYVPWLARVVIRGNFACTGAIIGERWIVTVAQCVTDPVSGEAINKSLIAVDVSLDSSGRIKRRAGRRYLISQVIRHTQYRPPKFNADIAVLKTTKDIKITSKIRPICLPSNKRQRSLFLPGRMVLFTGFSSPPKMQQNTTVTRLLQTCTFIVNRKTCNASFTSRLSKFYKLTSLMLCTPNLISVESHRINYSGALMTSYDQNDQKWILGGLTTWDGTPQYLHPYRVFTRMNKFVKWLRIITRGDRSRLGRR